MLEGIPWIDFLSPDIEWALIGIDERWRDGVRVIFRKRSATRNLAHWQRTLQPDLAEKACAG